MYGRPSARESKAIRWPSGDHEGEPVTGPPKLVNWRGPLPSILATHISVDPVRKDSKAMRDPSGEICALELFSFVAPTLCGCGNAPGLPSGTRQMLCCWISVEYINRRAAAAGGPMRIRRLRSAYI